MDILLTGGTGQVGTEILRQAWPADVRLHAPSRSELDLTDPASVTRIMAEKRWDLVISSGAYTAVDKAESDVGSAWLANAVAPAILARAAQEAGTPILHISTDYVFSGEKRAPYREDDPVWPIGVYGASKEGGEQAVRTGNSRHVILRTAWVVSAHRSNFLKTMLRLGAERDEIGVVSDQIGCPTFASDLASAIRTIALKLTSESGAQSGTFHFVNEGEASWADFAGAIMKAAATRGLPTAVIKPIGTADYPTPARRPANSRLVTAKIRHLYGVVPPSWNQSLEATLDQLS